MGIVSKRLGSRYRSRRSPDWLKFKNPDAPAVKREGEDWVARRLQGFVTLTGSIGKTEISVPRARLQTRCWRPRCRRAADKRDELPPLHHSITSSARASSVGGTARPSALAVLRLMKSSTFVDCWTGRSAGFSPLRMRPA